LKIVLGQKFVIVGSFLRREKDVIHQDLVDVSDALQEGWVGVWHHGTNVNQERVMMDVNEILLADLKLGHKVYI
jgi:hypothetical protein